MSDVTVVSAASEKNIRRSLFASVLGTSLESYDFYLYGTAAALYFGTVFFPESDPTTAALSSFLVFATAFLMRPIGAYIFGRYGDKHGRAKALRWTLLIMGLATAAIGLIPGHEKIGVFATIFLLTFRCIQGISLGGEWGGSILITAENATETTSGSVLNRRNMLAAVPQLGSSIGTIASIGIFLLMNSALSHEQMLQWGWRIPFLIALPFTAISIYVRKRVAETEEFTAENASERSRGNVNTLFTKYRKQLLIAIGVSVLPMGSYFLMITYTMTYGTQTLHLDENVMLIASLCGAGLQLITIPMWGLFATKFGAQRSMLLGMAMTVIIAVPLYWIMKLGTTGAMVFCLSAGGIFPTLTWAALGAYIYELFPVSIRYTGLSFSNAIAASLAGFVPALTTWFGSMVNNAWWHPGVVLMFQALIGVAACFWATTLKNPAFSLKSSNSLRKS